MLFWFVFCSVVRMSRALRPRKAAQKQKPSLDSGAWVQWPADGLPKPPPAIALASGNGPRGTAHAQSGANFLEASLCSVVVKQATTQQRNKQQKLRQPRESLVNGGLEECAASETLVR